MDSELGPRSLRNQSVDALGCDAFLSRRRQISRVDLASHLYRGNIFFDRYMGALQQSARLNGSSLPTAGQHSLAQLQQIVDAQANVLAFISTFFVLGVIVAFLVPLPFLMKKPSAKEMALAQGTH